MSITSDSPIDQRDTETRQRDRMSVPQEARVQRATPVDDPMSPWWVMFDLDGRIRTVRVESPSSFAAGLAIIAIVEQEFGNHPTILGVLSAEQL